MDRPPSLLIAGGGIGGLTAALACAEAGFRIRVLERSSNFGESGAGIQISPNAGRIIADLGLEPAIIECAAEPEGIEIRGWRGQRIVTLPLGRRFKKRHGISYRTVHRADLQDALASAAADHPQIDLLPGRSLVEFAIHERGLTMMVEHNGRHDEITADALIGADGIGSFVRSVMPGASMRESTGRSAWRTIIDAAIAPASLPRDRIGLWLGRAGHVVHYPVRAGREFNIVVVASDHASGAGQDFGDVKHLLRRWAKPVQVLLDIDGDWKRWPIATVNPSGPWVSGRVALLGDAAHAMVPYLAQGGAMAIEDAAMLAMTLGRKPNQLESALADYQAARRPRVRRVWRAAHGTADLYHRGALNSAVRNLVLRFLGSPDLGRRYDWIYRWRPPANEMRRPKAARSMSRDIASSLE